MTTVPSNLIHQAELLEKLRSRQALIGIVGLGYVGLPLSLTYAEVGYRVLGLDIDPLVYFVQFLLNFYHSLYILHRNLLVAHLILNLLLLSSYHIVHHDHVNVLAHHFITGQY